METPMVSVRLPQKVINDLKSLSYRETARRNKPVSWVELLREAASRYVEDAGRV